MPALSVIVPVYNVELHLRRTIDSLRAQTFNDFEAILIDDGSTDNSLSILREYEKVDTRLKVIHQQNSGVAHARNRALELAEGEYVYFMDADDWIDATLFEENLQLMRLHDANMVVFGYRSCNLNAEAIKIRTNLELLFLSKNSDVAAAFPDLYMRGTAFTVWNKIFRRQKLVELKERFLTQKIGEDAIFCLSIFAALDKLVINPKPYYNYLELRPGGAMSSVRHALTCNDELNVVSRLEQVFQNWAVNDRGCINDYVAYVLFSKYSVIAQHYRHHGGFLQYLRLVSGAPFSRLVDRLNNGTTFLPLKTKIKLQIACRPSLIYLYKLLFR